MRFTDEISLTPIPGHKGKWWRVNNGFTWHVGELGSSMHVTVEAGFIYDLASVPVWGRFLIPHTLGPAASALHDHGYRFNSVRLVEGHDGSVPIYRSTQLPMTRDFWDRQYYEGMIALDVAPWRAKLAYFGVRLGGWLTWNRYRRND